MKPAFPAEAAGARPDTFPGGAALTGDGVAWVLVEDRPSHGLGGALAWAHQRGLPRLHLLAEAGGAGVLARRAQLFAHPPVVWRIDGTHLEPASPAPFPAPSPSPPAVTDEFAGLLAAAGVTVVHEHGEVIGEVLGLEIARVTVETGDTTAPEAAPTARLQVGVGRHDREAFALVHGDVPPAQAVADVVAAVRRSRSAAGGDHPLRRLAPERWLREVVVASPALVGARALQRIENLEPRTSVKDVAPAAAAGIDHDGQPVVVACSVGVDLDLVPTAADLRAAHAADARLVLVLPARDDHPVTRRLAAALAAPATIVAIDGDWRSALG